MMHSWNDDWPHWAELYEAQKYITKYVKRYSVCRLWSKEKWGGLRYEYVWPPTYGENGPVIKLPFPLFYKTIQGEKFPRYLLFWTSSWLYYKWMHLGEWVLKKAVLSACKKFPNVKHEIMADMRWR